MAQAPYYPDANANNQNLNFNYQQQLQEEDLDADYAPLSPNLDPQYANYDPEPLPVHPQHQTFRTSVSHVSPFSPTGNSDFFGRGLSLQSPYMAAPQSFQQPQHVDLDTMVKPETADDDYGAQPKRGRGKGKKVKQETEHAEISEDYGSVSASGGIEVKTKFPVARIKRIMQADEDVGKVAQVTPVVVSKALELFMISIVTKAANEAKQRNSKRVLPAHLKAAVVTDEQFDFLNDIVSKVQDAPAPGSNKMNEGDSDEQETKKKTRGRKKKAADTEMI